MRLRLGFKRARLARREAIPYRAHLAGIVAAALVVRIFVAMRYATPANFSDMAEYNRLAVKGGFDAFRPPLYPLFLRAIYAVTGDYNYIAVYVAQAILGALTVLLMYRVVAGLWSRFAGLVAAIVCAVYPAFIGYTLTTLTETVSLLIVALMMSTAVSPARDRTKAAAQGVIAAVGILTKPAFLYFVPGLFLTLRRRALFCVVLAAIVAPWVAGNAIRFHRMSPVSESGALMFYRSYNPAATGRDDARIGNDTTSQSTYFKLGLDFIRHNKLLTLDIVNNKLVILLEATWDEYVMGHYVRSMPAIYALRYAFVLVLIPGLIGLARLYRREHRPVVWPVASYLVLIVVLSAFKYRYRLLVEPLLIAYAAMLISGGGEEAREEPR